jgi:sigma-B regulation protein RsbU (phosphoserine phosphatase)
MPGVLPGLTYTAIEQEIAPGSRLFIYSDGVYELRDRVTGRMRTQDDFVEMLLDPAKRDLDEIEASAKAVVADGLFDDDVSLVQVDFP